MKTCLLESGQLGNRWRGVWYGFSLHVFLWCLTWKILFFNIIFIMYMFLYKKMHESVICMLSAPNSLIDPILINRFSQWKPVERWKENEFADVLNSYSPGFQPWNANPSSSNSSPFRIFLHYFISIHWFTLRFYSSNTYRSAPGNSQGRGEEPWIYHTET